MILFLCNCGEELEAADNEAGQRLMCPICKRRVTVPRPGQLADGQLADAVSPGPPPHAPIQAPRPDAGRSEATVRVQRPQSYRARLALIFGLLSFCLPLLLSLPALILGIIGLVEVRRSRGQLGGLGLAIGGIACGASTIVLVALLVPVVHRVRDSANATVIQHHLKLIALGLDNYHHSYKAFPKQAIASADGRPLLSWRVSILPYIEEDSLYKRFKLDEPWDSRHNRALLPHMPSIYKVPGRQADNENEFATVYQGFVGAGAVFRASHLEKVAHADITDGLDKTLMIVEAASAVPWTKPEDLGYEPDRPLPRLGGHTRWGFHALLASGDVVRLDSDKVGEQTLRNAITINDGRPLGPEWPIQRH